jgi:hypothetical protein
LLVVFAVPLACFFTPDFLVVLFVDEVLTVFELEAAAGAVCANNDAPASASVIVIPIIAFFIVFFSFSKPHVSFASVSIDDSDNEPAVNALLIPVHANLPVTGQLAQAR